MINSQIRPEQRDVLSSLKCLRVRDIPAQHLATMQGVRGNGNNIVGLFRHRQHIKDENKSHLASYVVLAPDDTILLFFSLRCGELFEKVDMDKFKLARAAFDAFEIMSQEPDDSPLYITAKNAVQDAFQAGLSSDDIWVYAQKKDDYIDDERLEPNVSRVLNVYSGVELKFYGATKAGYDYWNSIGMPRKLGVTLFWEFIIPKLVELQNIVGCQYMYLFAADSDPDGHLVNYYRSVLFINADRALSSNKPSFDYNSVFLYQEISELKKQRNYFFDSFNTDNSAAF